MSTRRQVIKGGGLALAALVAGPAGILSAGDPVVIKMQSDPTGAHVRFNPIGLMIEIGRTVRWVNEANVHTVTAYHPDNDDHSLRIPIGAKPFHSDYLVNPGDAFETVLTVPGVYDYFCEPHEIAGMVGRIVVGEAGGPGAMPFDYFKGDPAKSHWRTVPKAARRAFPSISRILQYGQVM